LKTGEIIQVLIIVHSQRTADYFVILDLLEGGTDLTVITIISRKGSTPRLPGTRILVTGDGRTFGTIGGGAFETEAVRASAEVFSTRACRILRFTSVPGSVLPEDFICGGSFEILIEYLPADQYHRELIRDFVRCQDQRQTPVMVVPLPDDHGFSPTRFFIGSDGPVGEIPPGLSLSAVTDAVRPMGMAVTISEGNYTFLVEPCPSRSRLVLCGAGHIAAETAPLAYHLGFEVTVLDDRSDLLGRDEFSGMERVPVQSYETCLSGRAMDRETGILIVTRSHAFDLQVLRQALGTGAGYIGMIGSRHKWKTLSAVLELEGFGKDDLERVICPVGLAIGASSPEEIAISIAAELVRFRSGQRTGRG